MEVLDAQIVEKVLAFIAQLGPIAGYVLMGLGGLVVLGYGYIKITPTQNDDQWLQKQEQKPWIGAILKALIKYAPIQRKEK